uniref:GRIP domain-containing protein n=1 Tax=Anopheles epiroticus TaxID=199890 RepID=A0A182PW79_9DIPT
MDRRKHEVNKIKEYESIISSQKEHINRYESRLKDIIVAYKGIAKEKAALEQTLQLLNKGSDGTDCKSVNQIGKHEPSEAEPLAESAEQQVQKLMNNLTTITAERNRIEEVLKYERNQLRQKLSNKDEMIEKLNQRIKSLEMQCEVNNSIEYQNNASCDDQSLKIRELKKLLDDERNLKEQLELQLANLKTQFLVNAPERQTGLKKRSETKKTKSIDCDSEENSNNSINLKESLQELQNEMDHLKKQYAIAVADEKQRVRLAEESSKRLREIHEERVANFESRIRELSEMVGKYDRLKEQDKEYILQLKTTIANLKTKRAEETMNIPQYDCESIEDGYVTRHETLDDRSLESTEVIEARNIDIGFIAEMVVHDSQEEEENELEKYKWRYEQAMGENQRLKKELLVCQEFVTQLKLKNELHKQSTAQLELELQQKLTEQQLVFKNETIKHSEALNAMQASFERQIRHLQDSLQNQRERSLAVMDEKDEEIKTLRTSLEILSLSSASVRQQESNNEVTSNFQDDTNRFSESSTPMITSLASLAEEHQHLLHYAQEIARKNVEISALRTSKNTSETTLRKLAQDKVMIEETYKEKISAMEKEIDRLRRNQQLEGSNLEYLKNVVLSFLLTTDTESKKHMTNAIAAVLKFDEHEILAVNNVKN